jgi:hypothetical protein
VLAKERVERLARLIPAFTHCNTYISSWVFSGVPLERVRHNYFVHVRLQGVTTETVRTYVLAHSEEMRVLFFTDWRQLFATGVDGWVRDQAEYLARGYEAFVRQDFAKEIKTVRADYIVSEEPLSPTQQHEIGVTQDVGKFENASIYRL